MINALGDATLDAHQQQSYQTPRVRERAAQAEGW